MQVALITAMINAAVTWGVISTKLAWLRRDIDTLNARITNLETEDRRSHFRSDHTR
jgi:hypothetical protein